jgi:hypothetical protein
MRDEKSDKKGSSNERLNEREAKERRDDRRARFATDDFENPLIWRGMD